MINLATIALILSGVIGVVFVCHIVSLIKYNDVILNTLLDHMKANNECIKLFLTEKDNIRLCFKSLETEINDLKFRLIKLEGEQQ